MIFFGGMLQILGAIAEWILGNTFSMCLFFTYGTFWIVAGTQLIPSFAVGAQYSPTGNSLEGMTTSSYFATVGMLSDACKSMGWSLTFSSRLLLPLACHAHGNLLRLLLADQSRVLQRTLHAHIRFRLRCGCLLESGAGQCCRRREIDNCK